MSQEHGCHGHTALEASRRQVGGRAEASWKDNRVSDTHQKHENLDWDLPMPGRGGKLKTVNLPHRKSC